MKKQFEIFANLFRSNKKPIITSVIIGLALIVILTVLGQANKIAPFIYTFF